QRQASAGPHAAKILFCAGVRKDAPHRYAAEALAATAARAARAGLSSGTSTTPRESVPTVACSEQSLHSQKYSGRSSGFVAISRREGPAAPPLARIVLEVWPTTSGSTRNTLPSCR